MPETLASFIVTDLCDDLESFYSRLSDDRWVRQRGGETVVIPAQKVEEVYRYVTSLWQDYLVVEKHLETIES